MLMDARRSPLDDGTSVIESFDRMKAFANVTSKHFGGFQCLLQDLFHLTILKIGLKCL